MSENSSPLQAILLQLLPADHSTVGNITLWQQFQAAVQAAGIPPVSEDSFKATREALVASGQAVKGRGRGGSTARATGPHRPDFALQAEPSTPDLLTTAPNTAPATAVIAAKPVKPKAAPQATPPGDPQVLSYRHPCRRHRSPPPPTSTHR